MKEWIRDLIDSEVSGVPSHVLGHFLQLSHYTKFERKLELVFQNYLGRTFDKDTINSLNDRIRNIWSRMYIEGMVDCPVDEMPTYKIEFDHNQNLILYWNDKGSNDESR